MLKMRFGYPPVARTTGSESNRNLRNCAFHASAGRILFSKISRLLALAGTLLRFKMGLREQDRERSPLFMIISAEGNDRAH